VLYDAVGSPRLDAKFWKPLVDNGGEVRPFNALRFSITRLHFANFRTHRKIVICDGMVGFLGGMNLHDPASPTRSGKDAWRDQHVRIAGEPVRKLQRLFLENWTYAGGEFRLSNKTLPLYFPAATPCSADSYPVQIVASGPDDEIAPLHAFFLAAMATARKRIWIETPYLIPDEPFESALRVAELRGVDVQVIVPKEGDSKLVTMASRTYCQSLAKAGIPVHEFGPPMLHAKTMVIDETVAVVGTANLDNRSFRLNFEVAAAFYDERVIRHLARRFEQDRRQSHKLATKPRSQLVTQLVESVARLTSPVL
jgi:cardiolipin synthase